MRLLTGRGGGAVKSKGGTHSGGLHFVSYSGESRLNTCTMSLTETLNLGSGDLIMQFFYIVTSSSYKY